MKKKYNLSEFAELLNVHTKTLQRLDREKKLIAYRTITNRRYYTDEHIEKYYNYEKVVIV